MTRARVLSLTSTWFVQPHAGATVLMRSTSIGGYEVAMIEDPEDNPTGLITRG